MLPGRAKSSSTPPRHQGAARSAALFLVNAAWPHRHAFTNHKLSVKPSLLLLPKHRWHESLVRPGEAAGVRASIASRRRGTATQPPALPVVAPCRHVAHPMPERPERGGIGVVSLRRRRPTDSAKGRRYLRREAAWLKPHRWAVPITVSAAPPHRRPHQPDPRGLGHHRTNQIQRDVW